MNLEEAKEKVKQAIQEIAIYGRESRIDEDGIVETDFAWYIPFTYTVANENDMYVGAYPGFIVGKIKGDLQQPGSGLSIERWLMTYELGLLDGPHDLIITKIRNRPAAKHILQRLHLTYYKPEIADGVTWKTPQHFKDKMIEERLAVLPCRFKNQRFSFSLELFKEIRDLKIFEYELVKTVGVAENEVGERIG